MLVHVLLPFYPKRLLFVTASDICRKLWQKNITDKCLKVCLLEWGRGGWEGKQSLFLIKPAYREKNLFPRSSLSCSSYHLSFNGYYFDQIFSLLVFSPNLWKVGNREQDVREMLTDKEFVAWLELRYTNPGAHPKCLQRLTPCYPDSHLALHCLKVRKRKSETRKLIWGSLTSHFVRLIPEWKNTFKSAQLFFPIFSLFCICGIVSDAHQQMWWNKIDRKWRFNVLQWLARLCLLLATKSMKCYFQEKHHFLSRWHALCRCGVSSRQATDDTNCPQTPDLTAPTSNPFLPPALPPR